MRKTIAARTAEVMPVRDIESAISRLELRLVELDSAPNSDAIVRARIAAEVDMLYSAREIRLARYTC